MAMAKVNTDYVEKEDWQEGLAGFSG